MAAIHYHAKSTITVGQKGHYRYRIKYFVQEQLLNSADILNLFN